MPFINIEAIPDLIELALTCENCHDQAQKAAEEYEKLLQAIRIIGRNVEGA